MNGKKKIEEMGFEESERRVQTIAENAAGTAVREDLDLNV